MNNEPVAYFVKDKQGWWAETDKETGIPLYTHEYERPHNTVLVPCDKLAEMQAEIERLTMLCDCMTTESNRKGNEIEALKAHPVKELTDEEIYACFHQYFVLGKPKPTHYELEYEDLIDFAREILRKAQKNG